MKKVIEENATHVLVKMKVPKEHILFTNFRNWTDMECIYGDSREEPTTEDVKEILKLEFKCLNKTLAELWEDIFYIDESENIQLMFDSFNFNWVISTTYVNGSVISY